MYNSPQVGVTRGKHELRVPHAIVGPECMSAPSGGGCANLFLSVYKIKALLEQDVLIRKLPIECLLPLF